MLTGIGRGLGVMSRKVAPEGYIDLDHDDYQDPDPFKEWQQIVLDTAHRIVVCARIVLLMTKSES